MDPPTTVYGLAVDRIEAGHRVVLSDGMTILGDARLVAALSDRPTEIRAVTVLERMPPAFVVTFADGEVRHYQGMATTR